MAAARHEFRAHTSEVELFVEAPDLEALFSEAGRALGELMSTEPLAPTGPIERVTVHAEDRERLLAQWLNELIYLSERNKRIYVWFEVEQLTPTDLKAKLRGAATSSLKTAVKAATLHRLQISDQPNGVTGTVVLDV